MTHFLIFQGGNTLMIYVQPDKWIPAGGMELEAAADYVIKSNKNCIVIAGPGAGKTELLAQKACYLLQTNICLSPYKILSISFKTDSADNLAKRVEKRCGKELSRRFVSKTYDSFAKGIIEHFRMAIPEEYRPPIGYNIATQDDIKYLLSQYKIPQDLENTYGIHEISDREFTKDYLVKYKLPISNNGSNIYEWLIKRVWHSLLNGELRLQPALTFPMISRIAEYMFRTNPYILMALRMTYKYIFLDEFQDTTGVQYDLIKTAFLGSDCTLTAVGDDKQRIMAWAGALNNIFNIFENDFDAEEKELVMNHRSAPRLVEVQRFLSKAINGSETKIETSKNWKPKDGVCENWIFEDEIQEAEIVCEYIKTWIEEEKIEPNDICIIAKQNIDIYSKYIVEKLDEYNIKARNEGNYQDILSEEITLTVLNIIVLADTKGSPFEWTQAMDFFTLLKGYNNGLRDDKPETLVFEFNSLLVDLKSELDNITSAAMLKNFVLKIVNYFNVNALKAVFPQYKNKKFFKKLIDDLVKYLWEGYEKSNNWVDAVADVKGVDSIPIMTIHKSKGLEYDTVVFIGLEDGAFWSFRNQSQEDMCAFFVALSRAKRRAVFTFSNLRHDKYGHQRLQERDEIKTFYDILQESQVVEEITFAQPKTK